MQLNKTGESRKFLTILADGKIHQEVETGTEGAVVRTYDDASGVTQSKTELVFDEVSGMITGIALEEGEYGTNLRLEIDNDGVISMGTASSFGEDLMKKIPNVDLTVAVRIVPYSFVTEGGKSRKGVTVYQNDIKLGSYYYDATTKSEINGYPAPSGDTSKFSSDDWKLYFLIARKFLVGQVNNLIALKFPASVTPQV